MEYTRQSEYVRPSAAAIILNDKDQIFLVKRNNKPFKGLWMMPGGHMKVGETIEQCLLRELKEEAGMEATMKELFCVHSDPEQDPRHAALVLFYVVEVTNKKDVTCIEVQDCGWFNLKDVPQEMAFHHRRIFDKYLASRKT